MACPEMAAEAALLSALEGAARFQIRGRELERQDSEGAPLARFEAEAPGP
jgi:heat shock protein HslJ